MSHENCPSNSNSFVWSFLCVLVLPITCRNTNKVTKSYWVGPVLPLILSSDTVVLEGDLRSIVSSLCIYFFSYCAFHKHANSKVQKMPSQLRFSLPSIIIMITSTEPCNTQNGSKSTNHAQITNHDLLNLFK